MAPTDPAQIARQALKRLATRCLIMHAGITASDGQLEALVRSVNPRLLSPNGAGPVTAATLLAAAGEVPPGP